MPVEKYDEKKMQAECDLRNLIEAYKIRKDSARYKAAMAVRKERMNELSQMAGKEEKSE